MTFCSQQDISWASQQNKIILLNNWTAGEQQQQQQKTLNGSVQLIHCNPRLQKAPDAKLIWRDVIYTFFKARIFTVADKLKACWGCLFKSVLDLGAYRYMCSAGQAVWSHSIWHFKTSPHLLQKCVVDYKTSFDFLSAWWWADNDSMCISGCTFPVTGHTARQESSLEKYF